ncbi:unnamed protein product [Arctogadus glacialis]
MLMSQEALKSEPLKAKSIVHMTLRVAQTAEDGPLRRRQTLVSSSRVKTKRTQGIGHVGEQTTVAVGLEPWTGYHHIL